MNKTISPKITALTFGVLVISFLAVFYAVAWQEPTQAPPGGNVPNPLNISSIGQEKAGGLILNTGGALVGLIVDTGQTILSHLATPFTFDSSSRPSSPESGQFYYDQTDHNLYYHNGTMRMRIEAVPSGTGESCISSDQCESGYCVDGYCCDSACDTTCYSCAVPGLEGKCTALTDMAEDGGCSSSCSGCYNASCVNWGSGEKDTVGANTCTNTHYRCNGSGSCTAPKSKSSCLQCLDSELGKSFSTVCLNRGYDGCHDGYCAGLGCSDNPDFCNPKTCSDSCYRADSDDGWQYAAFECYNWVYD